MKYLKQFANQSDYQAFKESEEYITPNVNFVVENTGVKFNPSAKETVKTVFLQG